MRFHARLASTLAVFPRRGLRRPGAAAAATPDADEAARTRTLHLGLEVIFGAALAVVAAVLGLPLGMAALAAIMGALIAVTAVSAPATGLPIRGSRLHDRMGIDALLVGLAALVWVVGVEGAGVLAAAAGLHAALTALPGRLGARR